jgi:hypothetical protein
VSVRSLTPAGCVHMRARRWGGGRTRRCTARLRTACTYVGHFQIRLSLRAAASFCMQSSSSPSCAPVRRGRPRTDFVSVLRWPLAIELSRAPLFMKDQSGREPERSGTWPRVSSPAPYAIIGSRGVMSERFSPRSRRALLGAARLWVRTIERCLGV